MYASSTIVTVAIKFYIEVRYKKTNRHGTRIFTVNAKAEGDNDYIYVGEFHVRKENEKIYVPQPHMFCSFLSEEIQQIYDLPELLKLIP